MRHIPDVLFVFGLAVSTSGVYLSKGLPASLVYSGALVLALGFISAFRAK